MTGGPNDPNGPFINDLSMGAHDKKDYVYNDPGVHHLEVNSECNWTIKVVAP